MKFATLLLILLTLGYARGLFNVISYTIWVDDDIIKQYSIKRMAVSVGNNFFKTMQQAAEIDTRFKFVSINDPAHGNFITKIGRYSQNPLIKKYWMIYILNKRPDSDYPPGDESLSQFAVDNLIVEDKKHYLFWLKTVVFLKS